MAYSKIMAGRGGARPNSGGRRPGAGRPSLHEALERRLKGKMPDGMRKTDALVQVAIDMVMNPKVPPNSRLAALNYLTEHLDGRPGQVVEHRGGVGITMVLRADEDVP